MIRRALTALGARLLPLFGRESWSGGGHTCVVADLAAHALRRQTAETSAALAAIEAQDFVARGVPPTFDRLGLLALALDGAIERDRVALQAIERIEAQPRVGDRPQGLEWAYDELFAGADRLRQASDLLRQLIPHERTIRALLAGEVRS